MRHKRGGLIVMSCRVILLLTLLAIGVFQTCDGARRVAQRRKDTSRVSGLYTPTPSTESLQELAQAMGAAGFEHYTEGRPLVKRLIPANSQPDLDVVEHQGMIGKAGVDFPAFPSIPNTGFSCKNVPTGYYADLETDCQVFHICDTSRKISFLCPNGTIFSQSHLICDWWFKVDCASAPALYESSAEYYSNEQRKTHKVTQVLSKNPELQQIGLDSNARAESRRTSINIPSTTERLRYRQRLQSETHKSLRETPLGTVTATARSFQALFPQTNYNPTQRTYAANLENRRRNLVQLFTSSFNDVPVRSTTPTYSEFSTYRSTAAAGDYNSVKEMQVAAESASFTNNNNRQYLQDYSNKNYRPYPVYTPNLTTKNSKSKGNPNLTTLYDIGNKQLNHQASNQVSQETTTRRPTLIPYTKNYTLISDKNEPYSRPGISLLKDFLEKEKNKTLTTTETISEVTSRSDITEIINPDKNTATETTALFETATKIPQVTRPQTSLFTETASSDRLDVFSSTINDITTESTYQERRERLMKKLNLDTFRPTEPTLPTMVTEKFYGDQPNRPGLIVPPSLTPKTLHSLAIYYATALDNLSTTLPPEEEVATTNFDERDEVEESLPPLFSRQTINKYSKLFGQENDNTELLEDIKFDPNGTYNELSEDLTVQQSQNPLSTSPQIRELAQVFTHALSAYLQDPVQFRKALSDIRPTDPSFGDLLTTTEAYSNIEVTTAIHEEDDEILGFSDDSKSGTLLTALREAKTLNVATDYPIAGSTTTLKATETTPQAIESTPRSPFKCCGRISASYTKASTPTLPSSTPLAYNSNVSREEKALPNNNNESVTTTESSYSVPKYGGFQNNTFNNSPYGNELNNDNVKPLQEYVQVTNLPTAWGVDNTDSTSKPLISQQLNNFESKKIKTTTVLPYTTPVLFTETETLELENEEELQRAHSQSFVAPQSNILRHGKQLTFEDTKPAIKKPSEELEAPTISDVITTTTQPASQPPTTKIETTETASTASSTLSSIFTSPDSDNNYKWQSTFDNWASTVIDPITVNDGLSSTGPELSTFQLSSQTNAYIPNTATPAPEYTATIEQTYASSLNVEYTTQSNKNGERIAKLFKDSTSTEPIQDITTIADTVVEKAKQIMGGMNATTTEKLINVMKKTKSKTVRRLILLLVQTCDDDHNTTAEESKKALLEALMAVSEKDMDELTKEDDINIPISVSTYDSNARRMNSQRRTDRVQTEEINQKMTRSGKSLNFEASAINSLSNPTSESHRVATDFTEASTTQMAKVTAINSRGHKKFFSDISPVEPTELKFSTFGPPIAEARVASSGSDLKTTSDTRALELLRSLYTIAARWG